MGTRSLTFFYQYNQDKPFCCFYRQMDGYPTGHGKELSDIINSLKLVNGYSFGEDGKTQANGVGCLAGQVIARLKTGVGSIYLHAPDTDQDSGQEYEYHVHAWQPDEEDGYINHYPFKTRIVVLENYRYKKEIFDGTFEQFAEWVENPPRDEDGYVPVIHGDDTDERTLRDHLRKGVVKVRFTKEDGSIRVMRCTLNTDYIPDDKIPSGVWNGRRLDKNLYKVWDVEKKGWRSFREERVQSWGAE